MAPGQFCFFFFVRTAKQFQAADEILLWLHRCIPHKPEERDHFLPKVERSLLETDEEAWVGVLVLAAGPESAGEVTVSVTIGANPCLSLTLLKAEIKSHKRAIVKTVDNGQQSPGNPACSFSQWKGCLASLGEAPGAEAVQTQASVGLVPSSSP